MNLKMRTKRMLFMVLTGVLLSLSGCSSDEVEPQCMGTKVSVTQWLEYRYMLNGELVRPFINGLRIKMVGQRPIVTYDDGSIAEKYVYVVSQSESIGNEIVTYNCNAGITYTFDGIRYSEEAKDYTYITKGWHTSSYYYK